MKVLVILHGHYRSFDSTIQSWVNALENCEYEFRFSTYDEIDHNTRCWWHGDRDASPFLSDAQIEHLKKYDPNVEIKKQEFSEHERNDIYAQNPLKTYYYRFNAIKQILENVDESKYDMIVISRFDILIKSIKFSDISVNINEVKIGARRDPAFCHDLAASDMLCAFHPKNKSLFYNPPADLIERKFWAGEECWTDFYVKNFETVYLPWIYDVNFEIYNLTSR